MKLPRKLRLRGWRYEDGGAAIEFILIFPIFLAIFAAIIAFGLGFFVQQTMTLAAEEGARAAIAVDPVSLGGVEATAYHDAIRTQAQAFINANLTGLPSGLRSGITTPAATLTPITDGSGVVVGQTLTVFVQYPNFDANPVIQPLTSIFPLVLVSALVVPDNLAAQAVVQLF